MRNPLASASAFVAAVLLCAPAFAQPADARVAPEAARPPPPALPPLPAPPHAPPPAAPPYPPYPPPPGASQPWVPQLMLTEITFQPSKNAELQQRLFVGSAVTWQTLCRMACRVTVDARYGLRVTGDDVVETKTFVVEGPRVTLKADVSSSRAKVGGAALAAVGGYVALLSLSWLATSEATQSYGSTHKRSDSLARIGLLAGAAAGGIGLTLLITNWDTGLDVKATVGPQPASP